MNCHMIPYKQAIHQTTVKARSHDKFCGGQSLQLPHTESVLRLDSPWHPSLGGLCLLGSVLTPEMPL